MCFADFPELCEEILVSETLFLLQEGMNLSDEEEFILLLRSQELQEKSTLFLGCQDLREESLLPSQSHVLLLCVRQTVFRGPLGWLGSVSGSRSRGKVLEGRFRVGFRILEGRESERTGQME